MTKIEKEFQKIVDRFVVDYEKDIGEVNLMLKYQIIILSFYKKYLKSKFDPNMEYTNILEIQTNDYTAKLDYYNNPKMNQYIWNVYFLFSIKFVGMDEEWNFAIPFNDKIIEQLKESLPKEILETIEEDD